MGGVFLRQDTCTTAQHRMYQTVLLLYIGLRRCFQPANFHPVRDEKRPTVVVRPSLNIRFEWTNEPMIRDPRIFITGCRWSYCKRNSLRECVRNQRNQQAARQGWKGGGRRENGEGESDDHVHFKTICYEKHSIERREEDKRNYPRKKERSIEKILQKLCYQPTQDQDKLRSKYLTSWTIKFFL